MSPAEKQVVRRRRPATPAFIYHGFYEQPEEIAGTPFEERRYYLDFAGFRRHMEILAANGVHGCSLESFLAAPAHDGRRRAILTFDDGHISNYSLVWPTLQAHGFTATFFPVAGWIDRPSYMSPACLRELAGGGNAIGSHGLTHERLSTLPPDALARELEDSKRRLEDMLGAAVISFAAPGGAVSQEVVRYARRAGYRALCTSEPGWARDTFLIRRFSITNQTSSGAFAALSRGSVARAAAARMLYYGRKWTKQAIGIERYEKICRMALPERTRAGGS